MVLVLVWFQSIMYWLLFCFGSSRLVIARTDLRICRLGDFIHYKSPIFTVMTFDVITPQKCILWEALQFNLEQVMFSTHFEFQSCETKLWLPLFKGQKSPQEVISWLLSSVESQEGVSVQGPWDFMVSSHFRSISSRPLSLILIASLEISLSWFEYVIVCFFFVEYVRVNVVLLVSFALYTISLY